MAATSTVLEAKLNRSPGAIGMIIFGVVLIIGFGYAGYHLLSDLSNMPHGESVMPYVLLGVALLVALGFEFVNGFHDTANAVATVIYTHSLEPHVARQTDSAFPSAPPTYFLQAWPEPWPPIIPAFK